MTGARSSARLFGITALSASNIWVVGETGTRAVSPVIEHFDGTAWQVVAQPVDTYDSYLASVSAAGPDDIWAIGGQIGGTSAPILIEHFDGTAWTEVPNPALPPNVAFSGGLRAVTALGSWREILPTHWQFAWLDAMQPQITWGGMTEGAAVSVSYALVLLAVAFRHFATKDIVS